MNLSRGKKWLLAVLAAAATFAMAGRQPAAAQGSEPYVGQMMLVPYNFCPRGWYDADGSLIRISDNDVLFILLGTQYGGDGEQTFGLPDLRGRVPVGQGNGPGLSPYVNGQQGGVQNRTLTIANMPAHGHDIRATSEQPNKGGPAGKLLSADSTKFKYSDNPSAPIVTMNPIMAGATGGSQPFSIENPYTVLRWCISAYGIYPPQD